MAAIRFVDVQARPTEFLDLTSLTLDEFEQLIEPFGGLSKPTWPSGDSMASPALHVSLASTKIARCPHRRIAFFSC